MFVKVASGVWVNLANANTAEIGPAKRMDLPVGSTSLFVSWPGRTTPEEFVFKGDLAAAAADRLDRLAGLTIEPEGA